MSSILIDIEADELAIDNSKVELLKSQSNFIYYLFKTSIQYGNLVKQTQKTQTKDMKQWICLYGEESERIKAKKYIAALCNPEFIHNLNVTENLIKRLETNDFKNELIRNYQINLYYSRVNGLRIIIEGQQTDVIKTKSIIESELDKLSSDTVEDDDIILIDPYELFDSTNQIRPNRKMANFSTFKAEKITKTQNEFENKFEKMKVNQPFKQPDAQDILIKTAIEKGFKIDEIYKAFKELNTDTIGQVEFIEYLKTLRAFKLDHLSKQDDEIIEVFASTSKDASKDKTSPLNKKDLKEAPKAASSLVEYAEMFNSKEFDEQNEKSNKAKRISKLIAAMPSDEQKAAALFEFRNQINRVNNNDKKISPQLVTNSTEDINLEEDSDSIMIIDNEPTPAKDKAKLQESKKYPINAMQPVYNPAIYQDSTNQIDDKKIKNNANSKNNLFNFEKNSKVIKNRSRSNSARHANRIKGPMSSNGATSTSSSNLPHLANKPQFSNLRFIVIDGSNVAREHGKESGKPSFSCLGIKFCIDHFVQRGHTQIKALVPRFRRGTSSQDIPTTNPEILDDLEAKGFLTYTPSRYVNNKLIIPYDDRFILKAALHYNAIIVSNDNYRDLQQENFLWKKHIETCLLQYSFVGDLFMVADDPMGRRGPNIDQFLSHNNNNANYNNNNRPKYNDNNANSKNKRNVSQTTGIYNQLVEIFPEKEELIKKTLNHNPFQFDINFFTSRLLNE